MGYSWLHVSRCCFRFNAVRKLKTLDDPEHVMIVSIDGAASAMDYIRQEYVDMTVDNYTLALATIAVKAVLTKLSKEKN